MNIEKTVVKIKICTSSVAILTTIAGDAEAKDTGATQSD